MWTRSNFNKLIVPGYFSHTIDTYQNKRNASMWKDLMKVKTSKKAKEEDVERSGLGSTVIKGEG
jgi:hypothetical protein